MEPTRPDRRRTGEEAHALLFDTGDLGRLFGRYRILATIQRGGMGEVVLAEIHEGPQAARLVVLKRMLSDLLEDDRFVAMFRSEAEVMSQLDHPNIVKVLEMPVIEGKQCLALEYVYGQNLFEILRRCRGLGVRMPPQVALHIMGEVLEGLEYAHSFMLADGRPLQLVHRDMTPANILVSFDGEVKITDFGIAKSNISRQETTVGIVKGTTRYLSPEQIGGDRVTPCSDLFSCASVLVEMFTGAPLFERANVPATLFAITSGERERVEALLPFHAPLLAAVLERTLSTDPKDRPPSAKDLRATLNASAHEVGASMDRAGLGAFLKELFPESDGPMAAFQRLGQVEPELDVFDVTYLLELRDSMKRGGGGPELPLLRSPNLERVRDALAKMTEGAQPLDASAFNVDPEREATQPEGVSPPSDLDVRSDAATVVPMPEPPPPPTEPEVAPRGPPPPPLDLDDIWSQPGAGRPPPIKPVVSFSANALVLQPLQAEPPPSLSAPSLPRKSTSSSRQRAKGEASRLTRFLRMSVVFLAGALFGMLVLRPLSSRPPDEKPGRDQAPAETAGLAEEPDEAEAGGEAEVAPPSDQEAPAATNQPIEKGFLDIRGPSGARVTIDGAQISKRAPILGFPVSPGAHRVTVVKGSSKRTYKVNVPAGGRVSVTR